MKRLVVGIVLAVGLAACGGGGSSDDDGATAPTATQSPKATLGIITTAIETALGQAGFTDAEEGQQLDVGDRVRTDHTGFAEITYHDGSWQRVENRATLTIVALTADGSVNKVRTGIDIGRTWNNVRELDDPDDTYEVTTPVGTAAVRGTIFATDCTTDTCTITVLEGRVRFTPTSGDAVDIDAGEAITATDDATPSDPEPADTDDPWITKNQDLDIQRETGSDEGAAGRARRVEISACDAMSNDEATFLASQRDDGRTAPPMEQHDIGGPEFPAEGAVSSQCSWSSPGQAQVLDENYLDAGRLQLDLAIGNGFDQCGLGGDIEPPSGGEPVSVGEEARWYPERRTLIAYADGICLGLSHSSMDAGTAGREAFADVSARIMTRVIEPRLDDEPPRNMTAG